MTIIRKLSASDIKCSYRGEVVKIAYQKILRMTGLAVLIKFDSDTEAWIPKSQIACIEDGELWLSEQFANRWYLYGLWKHHLGS